MYLSRITIKPDAVKSKEFLRVAAGPYQIHSMIWELFSESEDQKRDFLYRVDTNNGKPVIYSLSQREPSNLSTLWKVETKPYNPQISVGMTLEFTLRVNPVITRTAPTKNGVKGKQSRHDVVMDAKKRIREEKGDNADFSMNELVQQEGFRWLNTRSERCGFSIREGDVRVDAYGQMNFMQGKKGKKITISTLDYNGVLTVTDKDKFEEALYHGIGPAKGFGCGLMMIKRI